MRAPDRYAAARADPGPESDHGHVNREVRAAGTLIGGGSRRPIQGRGGEVHRTRLPNNMHDGSRELSRQEKTARSNSWIADPPGRRLSVAAIPMLKRTADALTSQTSWRRHERRTRSPRHRHGLAVAAMTLVLLVSGCRSRAPADSDVTSPVTGLVSAVEGSTIEVRIGGELTGRTLTFEFADPTFPIEHLEEHRSQRLPVRVHFERQEDHLVATLVEDA